MFYNNNYKVGSIGPEQLNEKIRTGEDFFLLDVRTTAEHVARAIPGSHLVPLQELGWRVQELPRDKEIVVYCRVGNRSAFASSYLARLGFNVKNLEGGISLWDMTETALPANAS